MRYDQEPKYVAGVELLKPTAPRGSMPVMGRLYNRASGVPIPDDEPVFILRARDKHAAAAIAYYGQLCENDDHQRIVETRVMHFLDFATAHPDRMKEPDSP